MGGVSESDMHWLSCLLDFCRNLSSCSISRGRFDSEIAIYLLPALLWTIYRSQLLVEDRFGKEIVIGLQCAITYQNPFSSFNTTFNPVNWLHEVWRSTAVIIFTHRSNIHVLITQDSTTLYRLVVFYVPYSTVLGAYLSNESGILKTA